MEGTKAVSYLRTSSVTNVGQDKHSDRRQREAITTFAGRVGLQVVNEFYDAAVSGADPLETRPGFAALLDLIESNGVRTVLVEDASRFARDLVTQELGILLLIGRGVRVFTASGDELTASHDPMKVAMRQIAGAFAQLEKARLVSKLSLARQRKRQDQGKCEGRKSHLESRPDAVVLAKRLRRASPKTGKRRTLMEVSAELAHAGFVNSKGNRFSASAIKSMLEAQGRPFSV